MSTNEKRVAVFRKEHFNAAHRIFNPAWDDKKNFEVFGKCSNPHYHGHNYELVVKLTGAPNPPPVPIEDPRPVALFPNEWCRDPASAYFTTAYHDVPWQDPGLLERLVEFARPHVGMALKPTLARLAGEGGERE